MLKHLILMPLVAFLITGTAAAQDCVPQFAIYSPETVEAEPGSSLTIDVAVKNTGSCPGETLVVTEVPDGWSGGQFFTKVLKPGESEISAMKITLSDDAATSVVEFLGDSAEPSSTQVIIGGQEIQGNATSVRNETEPAQEQNQSQSQPAVVEPGAPVTGLLTSNPAVQVAVLLILAFGAGYLLSGLRKGEGYRYRFRR